MDIRLAKDCDIDGILKLLVQVNNVHANIRPDMFIMDKTKYNRAELAELLCDKSRPVFVCVDEAGSVMGYGFCVLSQMSGENLVPYKTIYIDDICVDEACRRQGVATKVYDAIMEYAKECGCYNVTLNVWRGNDGARAFYERQGMQPLKTTMEVVL